MSRGGPVPFGGQGWLLGQLWTQRGLKRACLLVGRYGCVSTWLVAWPEVSGY